MSLEDALVIVNKFIDKMGYMNNPHVLGCFFYGSHLTGFARPDSDIDLHIIFDDSDPFHIVRGNDEIDDKQIEYFEKPLHEMYVTADNDFENQRNALLSIIGTSMIVFDKTGDMEALQEYVFNKFLEDMPPLNKEKARELVSIMNNRMERLERMVSYGDLYFLHLYHLTLEKIRKFYHKLTGCPDIQTCKVYRIYTDQKFRESFHKYKIPDEEFIGMFLTAACDRHSDDVALFEKLKKIYAYATRDIELGDTYRINIQTRNMVPHNEINRQS